MGEEAEKTPAAKEEEKGRGLIVDSTPKYFTFGHYINDTLYKSVISPPVQKLHVSLGRDCNWSCHLNVRHGYRLRFLPQWHHILVVGLMTLILDWVYLIGCSKFVFNSM